ncbi:hypothetical protein ACFLTP_05655 [Chloroflexota bacterium]
MAAIYERVINGCVYNLHGLASIVLFLDDARLIQKRLLHSKLGVNHSILSTPAIWLKEEEGINISDLQFLLLHNPRHIP